MNEEMLEKIAEEAFVDEMSKISKLTVSDIEDALGDFLPDRHEDVARALIKKKTDNSFAIRPPFLTGVPTLGLWPAISKGKAVDSIVRSMSRKNPDIASMVRDNTARIRREEIEDAELQTANDEANRYSNAIGATMPAALSAISAYNNRNN